MRKIVFAVLAVAPLLGGCLGNSIVSGVAGALGGAPAIEAAVEGAKQVFVPASEQVKGEKK